MFTLQRERMDLALMHRTVDAWTYPPFQGNFESLLNWLWKPSMSISSFRGRPGRQSRARGHSRLFVYYWLSFSSFNSCWWGMGLFFLYVCVVEEGGGWLFLHILRSGWCGEWMTGVECFMVDLYHSLSVRSLNDFHANSVISTVMTTVLHLKCSRGIWSRKGSTQGCSWKELRFRIRIITVQMKE